MKVSNRQTPLHSSQDKTLLRENLRYACSGGVSESNRSQGFVPAFLHTDSGYVYRSRYPDGRPAPTHLFSGLPRKLMKSDYASSPDYTVKGSVISGFLFEGTFFTRESAAIALRSIH